MAQQNMQTISIPAPKPMEVRDSINTAEKWQFFRLSWENYEIATELRSKPNEVRVAILKAIMGADCFKIMQTLDVNNEEATTNSILDMLEKHFVPQRNLIYERYLFNTTDQEEDETIEQYVCKLKKQAEACEFGSLKEELIRDRLVLGIKDNNLRKRLLRDPKLTLQTGIDISRASEQTEKQMKKMQNETESLNKVETKQKKKPNYKKKEVWKVCKYCGNEHIKEPEACPAYGKTCNTCKKKNHFAKQCFKNKKKNLHAVEETNKTENEESSSESCYNIERKEKSRKQERKQWLTKINMKKGTNSKEIICQLDTGASCNVISCQTLQKVTGEKNLRLKPSQVELKCFGGEILKPKGEVTIECEHKGRVHKLLFQVVETKRNPIIGCNSCEKLGLLKIKAELCAINEEKLINKEYILKEYKDIFSGLGCIQEEHKLIIEQNSVPIQNFPRKIPIALKEEVRKKIEELERKDIIKKEVKPTPWISSMVIVNKRNKLRICIDPRELNKVLKRAHYQLPTIEDVLPELAKAKIFSILDAKNGFWQIKLSEESSKLTTFYTPWGRYRWKRLPFGIATAPEEFQRQLHEVFQETKGIAVIADDILVYGYGETEEEARKNHDEHLIRVLETCRKKNLKLNKDKMQLHRKEISYMGHKITNEGLKPDPAKVSAIQTMPEPSNVKELQRFLGCVNYIARFQPKLAETCEPLRQLTRKEATWTWDYRHKEAFEKIKENISKATILRYFDINETSTIQCDASQYGLGAVLMQKGQPIAFASKTLTNTERQYAQIEKECLAILFACKKFEQYIITREVQIESDHKPLETIFKKSILKAPQRLQRMLMKLQKYNLNVNYKRGKEMYLADTLSRAPEKETDGTSLTQLQIYKICEEIEQVNNNQHLNVTTERIKQIQKNTDDDEILQILIKIIQKGWPEKKERVPVEIREYWHYRDEVSVNNGMIFKGQNIIIPKAMRKEALNKIHSSHLGIEACLRKARDIIFWPHMSSEIKDKIAKCAYCNETKNKQVNQPMMTHPIPTRPWQRVAIDLFEYKGQQWIVMTDYYSDYWEIKKLKCTTTENVVKFCKENFSRYGIPDVVVTDNGPQFRSEQFKKFAKDWEFEHTTSSPYHHRSNGKIEATVKIVKKIIKRTELEKSDRYKAILDWRNTPTQGMGSSPVQRMMSRRTKTLLPTTDALLKPNVQTNVSNKLIEKKRNYKSYYDQRTKILPELTYGENVRVQLNPEKRGERWTPGRVTEIINDRTYNVEVNGTQYRRNRIHIQATKEDTVNKEVPEEEDGQEILHRDIQEEEQMKEEAQENTATQEEKSNLQTSKAQPREPEETAAKRTRRGRLIIPPSRYNQ